MHYVGGHYGTATTIGTSYNSMHFHSNTEHNNNNTANATTGSPSTTSVLRSWRKKDASEKQSTAPTVSEQPNTTPSESQGPVARVAPHNRYPKPSVVPPSDIYRYQQQYGDFSVQNPAQLATPVKYSEIIEPMQAIDQIPPIHLQKPKEKTYMEMCSVQQGHMKPYHQDYQNYKQHYDGLKNYNHMSGYKQQYHPHPYLPKESQNLGGYPVQKEPAIPHHASTQYLHNYKSSPPANYPRNYPRDTGNEFLANLNKIAPDMAQDIINDPHLRDPHLREPQYPMYPPGIDQNRIYQQQHHQRMYQRTSPIQHPPQNYPQRNIPQNFNQYQMNQQRLPPADHFRMFQPHQRYGQVEQMPSNISPRQYHENMMGFSPRISPNYPPCNQIEYAQHYQHRQMPMRQDFLPMAPNKSYNIEAHPEIPEIVPEDSLHQPKKTLKAFLENWREEFTEDMDSGDPANSEKIQLVKSAAANRENTLYVLDAMEIPSENIPQYLHLQPIEKLPANIRAFAYNSNEENLRQNAVVISANLKSEEPNDNPLATKDESNTYQLFQSSKDEKTQDNIIYQPNLSLNPFKTSEVLSHEDRPACKLLQSMANARNASLNEKPVDKPEFLIHQEKKPLTFEQETQKNVCRSLPELITEDGEDIGRNQDNLENDYSKIVDSILEENVNSKILPEKVENIKLNQSDDQQSGNIDFPEAHLMKNFEIAERKSVIAENTLPHSQEHSNIKEIAEKVNTNDEKLSESHDQERTISKVTNDQDNRLNQETAASIRSLHSLEDPIDLSHHFENLQPAKNESKSVLITDAETNEDHDEFNDCQETKHVYTDILSFKEVLNLTQQHEDSISEQNSEEKNERTIKDEVVSEESRETIEETEEKIAVTSIIEEENPEDDPRDGIVTNLEENTEDQEVENKDSPNSDTIDDEISPRTEDSPPQIDDKETFKAAAEIVKENVSNLEDTINNEEEISQEENITTEEASNSGEMGCAENKESDSQIIERISEENNSVLEEIEDIKEVESGIVSNDDLKVSSVDNEEKASIEHDEEIEETICQFNVTEENLVELIVVKNQPCESEELIEKMISLENEETSKILNLNEDNDLQQDHNENISNIDGDNQEIDKDNDTLEEIENLIVPIEDREGVHEESEEIAVENEATPLIVEKNCQTEVEHVDSPTEQEEIPHVDSPTEQEEIPYVDSPTEQEEIPEDDLDPSSEITFGESKEIMTDEEENMSNYSEIIEEKQEEICNQNIEEIKDILMEEDTLEQESIFEDTITEANNNDISTLNEVKYLPPKEDVCSSFVLEIAKELLQINVSKDDNGEKVISVTPLTKVKVVTTQTEAIQVVENTTEAEEEIIEETIEDRENCEEMIKEVVKENNLEEMGEICNMKQYSDHQEYIKEETHIEEVISEVTIELSPIETVIEQQEDIPEDVNVFSKEIIVEDTPEKADLIKDPLQNHDPSLLIEQEIPEDDHVLVETELYLENEIIIDNNKDETSSDIEIPLDNVITDVTTIQKCDEIIEEETIETQLEERIINNNYIEHLSCVELIKEKPKITKEKLNFLQKKKKLKKVKKTKKVKSNFRKLKVEVRKKHIQGVKKKKRVKFDLSSIKKADPLANLAEKTKIFSSIVVIDKLPLESIAKFSLKLPTPSKKITSSIGNRKILKTPISTVKYKELRKKYKKKIQDAKEKKRRILKEKPKDTSCVQKIEEIPKVENGNEINKSVVVDKNNIALKDIVENVEIFEDLSKTNENLSSNYSGALAKDLERKLDEIPLPADNLESKNNEITSPEVPKISDCQNQETKTPSDTKFTNLEPPKQINEIQKDIPSIPNIPITPISKFHIPKSIMKKPPQNNPPKAISEPKTPIHESPQRTTDPRQIPSSSTVPTTSEPKPLVLKGILKKSPPSNYQNPIQTAISPKPNTSTTLNRHFQVPNNVSKNPHRFDNLNLRYYPKNYKDLRRTKSESHFESEFLTNFKRRRLSLEEYNNRRKKKICSEMENLERNQSPPPSNMVKDKEKIMVEEVLKSLKNEEMEFQEEDVVRMEEGDLPKENVTVENVKDDECAIKMNEIKDSSVVDKIIVDKDVSVVEKPIKLEENLQEIEENLQEIKENLQKIKEEIPFPTEIKDVEENIQIAKEEPLESKKAENISEISIIITSKHQISTPTETKLTPKEVIEKPKDQHIDKSALEEKLNSLQEFLPKISPKEAPSPRLTEEIQISKKLEEILTENPISYSQKFSEMALIKKFLNHENLTAEEVKRVSQIVQYKRAIESLKKQSTPTVELEPRRRYSSESAKSIKIDFNDFEIKRTESPSCATPNREEKSGVTARICYNRSISAFIEEESKRKKIDTRTKINIEALGKTPDVFDKKCIDVKSSVSVENSPRPKSSTSTPKIEYLDEDSDNVVTMKFTASPKIVRESSMKNKLQNTKINNSPIKNRPLESVPLIKSVIKSENIENSQVIEKGIESKDENESFAVKNKHSILNIIASKPENSNQSKFLKHAIENIIQIKESDVDIQSRKKEDDLTPKIIEENIAESIVGKENDKIVIGIQTNVFNPGNDPCTTPKTNSMNLNQIPSPQNLKLEHDDHGSLEENPKEDCKPEDFPNKKSLNLDLDKLPTLIRIDQIVSERIGSKEKMIQKPELRREIPKICENRNRMVGIRRIDFETMQGPNKPFDKEKMIKSITTSPVEDETLNKITSVSRDNQSIIGNDQKMIKNEEDPLEEPKVTKTKSPSQNSSPIIPDSPKMVQAKTSNVKISTLDIPNCSKTEIRDQNGTPEAGKSSKVNPDESKHSKNKLSPSQGTTDNLKPTSKTKAQLKSFQDAKEQHNLSPVISNLTKLTALLTYYKKGIENGIDNANLKKLEDIINRLSPNLKNLPNLPEVSPQNEYEVSKDDKEYRKLKLHLKKKSLNEKKRKKRFRNLYTENESDEDNNLAPKPKEAKLDENLTDYSVYQRKNLAGVPKLVLKRRKSDTRNNLQPYVRVTRMGGIENMVKRKKRSIMLNQVDIGG